jgi:tRNA(fMet)-specific endonuclease VapC
VSRKYLLDTGPAGDFLHDRRGVRARAREARQLGYRIGICPPVLGEIVAGLEGSKTREENLSVVCRGLSELVLWPYSDAAAWEYGRIYVEMRRLGRVIQQIDMQLAAVAFALGNCIVVSSDSDLSTVPGLRVENWAAPEA